MIEESGRVVRVDADTVWIETIKQSACASCSAQKTCGQSLLAKIGDGQRLEIAVDNPEHLNVDVDDQVLLGVGERSFLTASVLIYLVPIVAMFLFAVMAQFAGYAEPVIIAVAVIGLGLGFLATRIITNRLSRSCSYRPVLLQKLN